MKLKRHNSQIVLEETIEALKRDHARRVELLLTTNHKLVSEEERTRQIKNQESVLNAKIEVANNDHWRRDKLLSSKIEELEALDQKLTVLSQTANDTTQ